MRKAYLLVSFLFLLCTICLQSTVVDIYDQRGVFVGEAELNSPHPLPMIYIHPNTRHELSSRFGGLPFGRYIIKQKSNTTEKHRLPMRDVLFTDVTSALMPDLLTDTYSLTVADFDGDGFEDIFFISRCGYGIGDTSLRIYIRQPNGSYIDESDIRLPEMTIESFQARLLDADDDGDMDILILYHNYDATEYSNFLLINDGAGFFSIADPAYFPPVTAMKAVVCDVNSDGLPDILYLVMNTDFDTSLELWINHGVDGFIQETDLRLPVEDMDEMYFLDIAQMDINEDSHPDFYVLTGTVVNEWGNFTQLENFILLNSGSGEFSILNPNPLPPMDDYVYHLKTADYDMDGDMDIIMVLFRFNELEPNLLILRNDDGIFTPAPEALPAGLLGYHHNALLIHDFDNDMYPDIFLACVFPGESSTDLFLRNAGNGTFEIVSSALPNIVDFTVDLALINSNGDSRMDVVVGNSGEEVGSFGLNRLYINQSTISVSDPILSPSALSIYPNPFHSSVKIRSKDAAIRQAEIYNIKGQLVKSLHIENKDIGSSMLVWNSDDNSNNRVANGVYLLRTQTDKGVRSQKLLLMK